jgi:hypothetical protein
MILNPEVYEAAAKDTTAALTDELRQSALEHGWEPKVANALHVIHGDEGFIVHVDEEHSDRAFVYEYGNEQNRPTAVVRKFQNKPKKALSGYADLLEHHARKL